MEYKCEIFESKDQPVLSIRTRTSVQNLPPLIGQAYGKIMARMAELAVEATGNPFVAYYNLDMQDLDVELGFPVPITLEGQGEIQSGMIPGGWKATTMHIGPYQEMAPAYDTLNHFVKSQGKEPTGVAYEYYLDPPTVPIEKTRTVIVFPLK
jgi:effector-binding domain-containing protein